MLPEPAVVAVFDNYGFSPEKKLYVKLLFASAEAHLQARFAMQSPVGSVDRRPPFSKTLLVRIFGKQREPDIQKCFDTKKGVRRSGMEFVLAEANIAFDHQQLQVMGVRPGGVLLLLAARRRKEGAFPGSGG